MNCQVTFVSRCSMSFAPDPNYHPKSYQTTRLHVTSLEATNPAMPYFKAGVTGNGQISETSKWTLTHFEIFFIQRKYCILIEIYTCKTNPSDVIHSPECMLKYDWILDRCFFWCVGCAVYGLQAVGMEGWQVHVHSESVWDLYRSAVLPTLPGFFLAKNINYYTWLLFFPSLSLKDVLQLNIYILHNPM